jgi:hypothetical protein
MKDNNQEFGPDDFERSKSALNRNLRPLDVNENAMERLTRLKGVMLRYVAIYNKTACILSYQECADLSTRILTLLAELTAHLQHDNVTKKIQNELYSFNITLCDQGLQYKTIEIYTKYQNQCYFNKALSYYKLSINIAHFNGLDPITKYSNISHCYTKALTALLHANQKDSILYKQIKAHEEFAATNHLDIIYPLHNHNHNKDDPKQDIILANEYIESCYTLKIILYNKPDLIDRINCTIGNNMIFQIEAYFNLIHKQINESSAKQAQDIFSKVIKLYNQASQLKIYGTKFKSWLDNHKNDALCSLSVMITTSITKLNQHILAFHKNINSQLELTIDQLDSFLDQISKATMPNVIYNKTNALFINLSNAYYQIAASYQNLHLNETKKITSCSHKAIYYSQQNKIAQQYQAQDAVPLYEKLSNLLQQEEDRYYSERTLHNEDINLLGADNLSTS